MPVKTHQRELKSHTLLGYFDFLHGATKCVFHSWCCVSSRIKTESQNDAECAITEDIKRNTSLGGEKEEKKNSFFTDVSFRPIKILEAGLHCIKNTKICQSGGQ